VAASDDSMIRRLPGNARTASWTVRAARGVKPARNSRQAPAGQPALSSRSPVRSEIVPAAADRVTGHPEQREYHARYQDDDADRPDDGNPGDEPDNEENDSEDNQEGSQVRTAAPGRRQKISLGSNSSGCDACCAGEGCLWSLLRLENREHSQAKPGQRLRASFALCPLSLNLPATSPAFPLARSRLFPVALPAFFLALPFIILALSLAFLPRPMAGSSVFDQRRAGA